MKRPPKYCLRDRVCGTSLIEVLVAVVILAVGLLGVAGMQMSALRNNQMAYERSAATFLTNSIAERMAANRTALALAAFALYDTAMCAAPGSANALAQQDLISWIADIQSPGMLGATGCGSVNCTAAGVCTIAVQWSDSRSGVSGVETPRISLEVRL